MKNEDSISESGFIKSVISWELIAFSFFVIVFGFSYQWMPVLWLDEAYVVNVTYEPDMFRYIYTYIAHPPLYYLLIKFSRILFGDTESTFRAFSFIFFVLMVPSGYWFTRKLFGESTARFSLPFFSTNYFLLFYSNQVRPYGLMAFLSLLSFLFYFELLKKFTPKTAVLYAIFTVLGLYTHYWFVLLFATQLLLLLIFRKETEFWKVFLTLFISGLIFLPWSLLYLKYFQSYASGKFIEFSDLKMLASSMEWFGKNQWIAIGLAVITGSGSLVKNRDFAQKKKELLFLLIYFTVPVLLAYMISKFIPIYTPGRREIIVLPAFMILLSYVASQIRWKYWFYILTLLLILSSIRTIFENRKMLSKPVFHYGLAVEKVVKQSIPNETVIVSWLALPTCKYYLRRFGGDQKLFSHDFPSRRDLQDDVQSMLQDNDKMNQELHDLQITLNKTTGKNIYVFLNTDPVSKVLSDYLDARYKRLGGVKIAQLGPALNFQPYLLVYSREQRPQHSRSEKRLKG